MNELIANCRLVFAPAELPAPVEADIFTSIGEVWFTYIFKLLDCSYILPPLQTLKSIGQVPKFDGLFRLSGIVKLVPIGMSQSQIRLSVMGKPDETLLEFMMVSVLLAQTKKLKLTAETSGGKVIATTTPAVRYSSLRQERLAATVVKTLQLLGVRQRFSVSQVVQVRVDSEELYQTRLELREVLQQVLIPTGQAIQALLGLARPEMVSTILESLSTMLAALKLTISKAAVELIAQLQLIRLRDVLFSVAEQLEIPMKFVKFNNGGSITQIAPEEDSGWLSTTLKVYVALKIAEQLLTPTTNLELLLNAMAWAAKGAVRLRQLEPLRLNRKIKLVGSAEGGRVNVQSRLSCKLAVVSVLSLLVVQLQQRMPLELLLKAQVNVELRERQMKARQVVVERGQVVQSVSPLWKVTGTELMKLICGLPQRAFILRLVLLKKPELALKAVSLTLQLDCELTKFPAKSEVVILKVLEVAVCAVGGLFTPLTITSTVELAATAVTKLRVTQTLAAVQPQVAVTAADLLTEQLQMMETLPKVMDLVLELSHLIGQPIVILLFPAGMGSLSRMVVLRVELVCSVLPEKVQTQDCRLPGVQFIMLKISGERLSFGLLDDIVKLKVLMAEAGFFTLFTTTFSEVFTDLVKTMLLLTVLTVYTEEFKVTELNCTVVMPAKLTWAGKTSVTWFRGAVSEKAIWQVQEVSALMFKLAMRMVRLVWAVARQGSMRRSARTLRWQLGLFLLTI